LTTGESPRRAGNAHQNLVPYQVFASSDGHLIVAVGNDSQFRAYCKVIGMPELAEHELYRNDTGRIINRDTLVPILTEAMKTRTRDYWLAELEAVGVPAGPINNIAQVYADPHVQARGIKVELSHATAG